jgi:hypothetical protein
VSVLVDHALPNQTREAGIIHEAREFPLDLDCADHVGNPFRLGLLRVRRVPGANGPPCQCTMKAVEQAKSVAVETVQSFLDMKRLHKVRYRTSR